MSNYFVIGDIHGRIDLLTMALREWDKDKEKLVFLGNYLDYGPNSREVLNEVKAIKDKYGAITIAGKHDVDFLKIMKYHNQLGINNRGLTLDGRLNTFKSLFGEEYDPSIGVKRTAINMKVKYNSILDFLEDLNLYYETDDFIFASSGVDLLIEDWHDSNSEKYYNSGSEFIRNPNKTNKIITFGHFRTGIIRGMNQGEKKSNLQSMAFLDDRYWVSKDGTKLGLNGGPAFNGNLLAARLSDTDKNGEIITIKQNRTRTIDKIEIDKEFNRIK